jgi:hypothetical protein
MIRSDHTEHATTGRHEQDYERPGDDQEGIPGIGEHDVGEGAHDEECGGPSESLGYMRPCPLNNDAIAIMSEPTDDISRNNQEIKRLSVSSTARARSAT